MSSRVKIADICTKICSGGTPKSGVAEYYENGKIPWLNTGEINFNRIRHTNSYITEAGLANSSAKWISKNSISIAMYGATAGKAAIVKIPLTTNQACCNLEVNERAADYRFVYYWLQYNYSKLANLANGGAQQNLSAKTIKALEIDLPPMPVQRSVAEVLSRLDDKVELNNRLNDYLDEYASALFEDWISCCTETAAIGDIAREILDYTKHSGPFVKLINSSDVTEGVFPDPEPVENKDLKGHFKKRFKKHDILYSEIRPRNHHYGYVMFDADDWISTTRLMVIRNRPEKVSSGLLYYYLKSKPVTEEFTLKTETRSGTFPQGKYVDIAAIEVPYLPLEKQAGIAQSIATALETIYANQAENERLVKLRDTLLPKLMSGEMSVSKIALPAHPNSH